MTKELIYRTAIEVVVDGITENPKVSATAIKNFLQTILEQNKGE